MSKNILSHQKFRWFRFQAWRKWKLDYQSGKNIGGGENISINNGIFLMVQELKFLNEI